ncbi:MAG: hypothetical protein AVDCRST_MAG19-4887 [uncultured Thermomicrobiales bacterium]|uniref:Uncharacterized protein n=1 Tax=uncultured Thermomicrobiales bacterium TaxID=1645740 RepID=A0A6J4VTG3_9BACT|nr:MAG: hypothetical protein AVDCRST_MAG19-4887 [uncultured Thermomicrobiales bacterium]
MTCLEDRACCQVGSTLCGGECRVTDRCRACRNGACVYLCAEGETCIGGACGDRGSTGCGG